jgi:hypothetical protein
VLAAVVLHLVRLLVERPVYVAPEHRASEWMGRHTRISAAMDRRMTDDLPFAYEPAAANPAAAPRKCRHPKELRVTEPGVGWTCSPCGHFVPIQKSAAGRRTRKRGNAKELASAKRNGTTRTGQYGGKDDYSRGPFAFQNKSFATGRYPGWMNAELDALRLARPSKEPILHVEESPGPGRRARRLYVMDERSWFALHGEDVA